MDPSRKRAIRLVVALTAALLLASALVYTSFSAGRDEVTASQLLTKARPGRSYILAGTVISCGLPPGTSMMVFASGISTVTFRSPYLYGNGSPSL